MIRLGLTGSIGMGKSTIAKMFATEGVPVWDADAAVHKLYTESDILKAKLTTAFGEVMSNGIIDRDKLSKALKQTPQGFETLNAIVHPAVVVDREAFIAVHKSEPLVVVDIPLLFETYADEHLDKVLVVTAPPDVQAARVLDRPGMTVEKFEAIRGRQMPDAEKRKRADFIIDTSQSLEACRAKVKALIHKLS